MRLRKKWWANDALNDTKICYFDARNLRNKWQDKSFNNNNPIYLELGCGRGTFINQMSKRYPNRNFIGVDIETNAMVEILKKEEISLATKPNMRLLVYNIECIEEVFAPKEIDGIFINFCNPWPKKSQHKRRLTHPRQLLQYRTFLKEGGYLELKTDDLDLFEASLLYLPDCGFSIVSCTANLTLDENPYGIITEYEEKWRNKNISIKYIKAQLTQPKLEPTNDYQLKKRPLSQEIYLKDNRI